MRILLCILGLVFTVSAHAGFYPIDPGNDYRRYSQSDMQRRVYDLEKAVEQLQQKLYQIERDQDRVLNREKKNEDAWICIIRAAGIVYTGLGNSKALATVNVLDSCKKGGDPFLCKEPRCEK